MTQKIVYAVDGWDETSQQAHLEIFTFPDDAARHAARWKKGREKRGHEVYVGVRKKKIR